MWFLRLRFPDAIDWLANYLGATDRSSSNVAAVYAGGVANFAPRARKASAAHLRRMKDLTIDSMRRITNIQLAQLSNQLGVSVESLQSLCVGYSTDHHASTWPMRDAAGQITGIRLRLPTDEKRSIRSSLSGLFLLRSQRPTGEHLFVVEGASDVAAGFDLGLHCIGRPSCTGGVQQLREYIARHGYRAATVVADHDSSGITGAIRLAKCLSVAGIASRVLVVPQESGDLRGMMQSGAEIADIDSLPIVQEFEPHGICQQLMFEFAA
jgi:hypothetical protein